MGCDHTAKFPSCLVTCPVGIVPLFLFISSLFTLTLQGYKCQKAFIVTQMPLQHTVADFLRLVFDFDVSLVVMLNDITKNMVRSITLPSQYIMQ